MNTRHEDGCPAINSFAIEPEAVDRGLCRAVGHDDRQLPQAAPHQREALRAKAFNLKQNRSLGMWDGSGPIKQDTPKQARYRNNA
ncbi:hypothetical protein EVAR_76926_1 [Eumeta japonica]|uniref:Uncharacterized protein n=1 Tax=Eumeta variegata TaxID=151549 RepID=A0A4C1SF04_EUMVA|nr:hypothetical protein EVAR_76926_1 [Eumeta japonica]